MKKVKEKQKSPQKKQESRGREKLSVKEKFEVAGIIGGLALVAVEVARFFLDYIIK